MLSPARWLVEVGRAPGASLPGLPAALDDAVDASADHELVGFGQQRGALRRALPQAQGEPEPEIGPEQRVRPLAREVRRRPRDADADRVEPSFERRGARLVLQVHDELVLEAPDAEVEQASGIVQRVMETAATLKVRLEARIGAGKDWLSAK